MAHVDILLRGVREPGSAVAASLAVNPFLSPVNFVLVLLRILWLSQVSYLTAEANNY